MSAGDLVSGEIKPALGLPFKRSSHRQINNANGKAILEVWSGGCSSNEEADAIEELIVRACNRDHAFDDLVKALQQIVIPDGSIWYGWPTKKMIDNIRAALAKAGANN